MLYKLDVVSIPPNILGDGNLLPKANTPWDILLIMINLMLMIGNTLE
jgi:hypothetical protein